MNTFVRGQKIRLRTDPPFRDATGVEKDPATVTVRVTDPAAATTDYTLAAAQVVKDLSRYPNGDFYYDLATAAATDAQLGSWIYAWIGTGDPAAASKNVFALVSDKKP